jgi:hypothetical protein
MDCQFVMMNEASHMKKCFALLLMIFLVSISVARVHAATITPAPTPIVDVYKIGNCEAEPDDPTGSNICHVRYDVVNSVLKPSQTDTTTSTDPLVGLEKVANMIWAGVVKPADNNYALGDKYWVPYGNAVENASFQDLTSATLQDITVHNTSPMRYCTTSRLCVADPTTGKLAGDFITELTWCTAEDIPGAVAQTDGTQRLASYTTNYMNPSQVFVKSDVRVKKIVPPSCGERSDGDVVDQSTVSTIKEHLYTQDDKTSIPYTITADMQTEQTVRDKFGELITRFIAKFPVPATLVAGGKNPYAAQTLCNSAGCPNPDDTAPSIELTADQKQALRKGGGWVNMYRSDAFDPNYKVQLNIKQLAQEFEALFSKVNTADTVVYAQRRIQEGQTFAYCSLLPENMQKKPQYYPGGECDKSWVADVSSTIASSPPSPENSRISEAGSSSPIKPNDPLPASAPTIFSGATASMVPACVLQAVATIEGAFDGTTSCTPDACGAVGPFQLSIGKCTKDCHASSCPNVLPKNMTKNDVCGDNWDKAADLAASVLIGKSKYFGYNLTNADPKTQKDAIIIAGDSYNGTTKTIPRLTSSTGQPLTYGEWVYAHCDPSYTTHVEHSFPAPGAGTPF